MVFRVIWTEKSKENLQKIERNITTRIIKKVEFIKDNPLLHLNKLIDKGVWKLRVGDYRVLIDIDFKNKVLYVLKVGHRKNIYDF